MPAEAIEDSFLQEQHTAGTAVVRNRQRPIDMKTRHLKKDWLSLSLGIVVVAGTVVAATAYFDIERRIHAEQAFTATLDRLSADQELSVALKQIHEGKVNEAVERMDLLLCDHILQTDSELPSASARTRSYVEIAFQRIAQLRPKTGGLTPAPSARERDNDQAAAERILSVVLGSARNARPR